MFWIEGWIEAATWLEEDDTPVWSGVVDLAPLIQVADEDSEQLFGLSKFYREKQGTALAAERGLPADPSERLRQALDCIHEHEKSHDSGEFGGYTHALWSEFEVLPPANLTGDQWHLPFTLAKALANQFGRDRVRFVVWYNW
jgi:hypothetical protein